MPTQTIVLAIFQRLIQWCLHISFDGSEIVERF